MFGASVFPQLLLKWRTHSFRMQLSLLSAVVALICYLAAWLFLFYVAYLGSLFNFQILSCSLVAFASIYHLCVQTFFSQRWFYCLRSTCWWSCVAALGIRRVVDCSDFCPVAHANHDNKTVHSSMWFHVIELFPGEALRHLLFSNFSIKKFHFKTQGCSM